MFCTRYHGYTHTQRMYRTRYHGCTLTHNIHPPTMTFDLLQVVTGLADASCNIIFGAVVDDAYEGIINVTIIGGWLSEVIRVQPCFGPRIVEIMRVRVVGITY
eukprot:1138355-Pelagomonas_calceolata.AAC.2